MLKEIFESFDSEITEEFLELLLNAMGLFFVFSREFRRQIEGFEGRYLFRSRDGGITISTVFKDGKMKVKEKEISNTDIIISFKNAKALRDFIFSPKPDILGSILRQDVVVDGNLNYMYKFAYMAKRLQLMATGQV
ncbi:MAG: hypothetical protein HUN04_11800 [Desulfobacter sp.]|nr:MAG: hypothetical protein HUN04_11800 [Desulfobacter sp.]